MLLIDLPERSVEHHHRAEGAAWALTVVRDGALDLADLGGAVALDEVYLPNEP